MNRRQGHLSYADQPGLLDRVFSLLDLAFPGLPDGARMLEPLGLRWDHASTPFLVIEDDQILSHVGVLEVPMFLDGVERLVGGIHAVCTHPRHRRRGYFRLAMEEALAWCDERYATTLLIGGPPQLYEPFGFRVVHESRFVAPVEKPAKASGRNSLRRLALDHPADLCILHRLLDNRAPISRHLGVVRERAVFLFTQGAQPMWYAEDIDAIFCMQIASETLCIYDLVATRIPTLDEVLECIDTPLKQVEVYFIPDQLDTWLTSQRHMVDEDSWLMARGDFPDFGGGLMLPRSCRF